MVNYIFRRTLYALPILLSVNILTFLLFFVVNSPDNIARIHLGVKHTSLEDIENWKRDNGYDKPLFFNKEATGLNFITDTIFYQKSLPLLFFNFGLSDAGRDINTDIKQRMWPSLAIAVPSFVVALMVNIALALWMVYFRYQKFSKYLLILSVALMSISPLFYIAFLQLLFASIWQWVPISGYQDGLDATRFIILPVLIGVIAGLGAGVRWYRSIILEEVNKPYVLAAFARGLSQNKVLFKHILKNAMIPILTGVVVVIPSLFLGSLLIEAFFAIPGLGSYTIDAIASQDFSIVRAMVFLGSVLYIIGLLLTDIAYTLVDPRVRLK